MSSRSLTYIALALVALLIAGLGAWYVFLRDMQQDINIADAGRGAGLSAPSFGEAIGSTYSNIVSSITSVFGGGETAKTERPRLYQVSKTPTAGLGFVGSGTSTKLRFVERSTGYVFDADPDTGELSRIYNTLTPKIYEALVSSDGKIIERTVDDAGVVATAVIDLGAASSTLPGYALPANIRAIVFSPSGTELFAILPSSDGAASGMRSAWNGSGEARIFSSLLEEWTAHWVAGRIVVAQQSADGIGAYAYEIGGNGALTPVARNVPGLSLLPRASSTALLYGSSDGALSLFARAGATVSPVSLPIRTTADKCVWAPGSQLTAYCAVPQRPVPADYLAQRARGQYHSADAWWQVDASAGVAQELYFPGDILTDVERPTIDARGRYIAFVNAADRSLWLLRVSDE